MDKITADDVRALIDSNAMYAVMVRYPDGSVGVTSTLIQEDYEVIISQEELSTVDHSGNIDFTNISDADAEVVAEQLNINEDDD